MEKEFYARAILYTPFVMGGDTHQHYKYKLKGKKVVLTFTKKPDHPCPTCKHTIRGKKTIINAWCARRGKVFSIFEERTGGFLGEGRSREAAVKKAQSNLDITPDFLDQLSKLKDIDLCSEEETKEVLRRLDATEKRKKNED